MKIDILTLFPEFFLPFSNWSIIGRAKDEGKVQINCINIRDYSRNKHRKVDDYPFGGGPGMVMKPEPIFHALEDIKTRDSRIIYLSPQGKVFNQALAMDLSREKHLVLLCGHYEGIDNRIIDNYIDEEISMGDFVLTGGEIPSMLVIDAVVRLLPGVLSSDESFIDESHYNGLLEYPQYTRPREFNGHLVPEILLSGHHGEINKWRRIEALRTTLLKRPDLISKAKLNGEDLRIVSKLTDCMNKNNKL